ncbi:hypothetical protein B2J93_7908 [Marssonina coronariae]|uniref:Uncharacterized protein n=1 Tax=Diplocarpon coronariae TaxID=2795749 RepID=A0A218ZCS5_9HELO|nr:hypothetical protein B2J93_7908 [Marssonina coronariae]
MSNNGDLKLGSSMSTAIKHRAAKAQEIFESSGESSDEIPTNFTSVVGSHSNTNAGVSIRTDAIGSPRFGSPTSPLALDMDSRHTSLETYRPCLTQQDPMGLYADAYRRLAPQANNDNDSGSQRREGASSPNTSGRRMGHRSTAPPFVIPKRSPRPLKKPRLSYGQVDQYAGRDLQASNSDPRLNPRTPCRGQKYINNDPAATRERSSQGSSPDLKQGVYEASRSSSRPITHDEDEDEDMDDRHEGDRSYTEELVRYNDRYKGKDFRASPPNRSYAEDDEDEEIDKNDTESSVGMFVPTSSRLPNGPKNQGRQQRSSSFNHDTFFGDVNKTAPIKASRGRKSQAPAEAHFNNPGKNLAPSRYSGASMPWGTNQDPPSVFQEEVSDAALMKRGLTRGKEDKVCKRGYGANDPENIAIVNMKEKDGLSFTQIVETLNNDRVASGKAPSLSVCGVTSRYNRTAPLLFAAEGKQFIPLSKRGKKGRNLADGPHEHRPVWSDSADILLVRAVQEDAKGRWIRIAAEFNRTRGVNMPEIDEFAAARRHTML